MDFVDRADQLHSPFGLAFAAFRRFDNLPHGPTNVCLDGLREHRLRGEFGIEILQSGQDAFNQKLNPRKLPCAPQPRVDRCGYSAAIRVAEHDEKGSVQMTARILQAARDLRREHISRDADDEQLAEAGIENQLRRYPRITATQDRGIGTLSLCEFSENFFLHRGKSRPAGDKPRVALFQALQGFVGRRSGIGNRAHVSDVVGALILARYAAVTALGSRLRPSCVLDFSLIPDRKDLWKINIAFA